MVESCVFFDVDVAKLVSWVVELSGFYKYIKKMQIISYISVICNNTIYPLIIHYRPERAWSNPLEIELPTKEHANETLSPVIFKLQSTV